MPYWEDKNMLFIITCKFTKKKLFLSNFNEWSIVDWINVLLIVLIKYNWDIFIIIINDRDFKFMSAFWKIIFNKLEIIMITSVAYHSQINDQSKKINQIVEIALRFHFIIDIDD